MKITPIHAGEILLEEFMQPYELSQNALAKALRVTPRRINEIVNKKEQLQQTLLYVLQSFLVIVQSFG